MCPDSFEEYATQRPSGEKAPCGWLNKVVMKGRGSASPSRGRSMRSVPVVSCSSAKSRKRPSGETLHGNFASLEA